MQTSIDRVPTPGYAQKTVGNESVFEYRQLLHTELVERVRRNPRYSVRAMARDLGVSAAFLSQVLNGRRHLSEAKALEVGRKLGWKRGELEVFGKLVRLSKVSDPEMRASLMGELSRGPSGARLRKHFGLPLERFKVIADWHHFAILELTAVRGFESGPAWIASRLGISKPETEAALVRLQRIGLLVRREGRWVKSKDCVIADAPSEAIRRFHSEHLRKAAQAMGRQPFETRHLSGMTIAVDRSRYELAIRKITAFREEMEELLSGEQPDSVYQLSVQLFRLDEGG